MCFSLDHGSFQNSQNASIFQPSRLGHSPWGFRGAAERREQPKEMHSLCPGSRRGEAEVRASGQGSVWQVNKAISFQPQTSRL